MSGREFDQVMAIYQEFGPNRATPVEERWLQRFPDTPASQLAAWARLCQRIEDAAYSLAEAVLDHRIGEQEARDELGRQFPHLSSETLARTHSQAMYFAAK